MAEVSFSFQTHSEEETRRFGRVLGGLLPAGATVLLSGDLGTGKTVLAQGIGEALGVRRVRSPSFTLVNEYPGAEILLVHVDLYRLVPKDVGALALEDYFDSPCVLLVEWPDRWESRPERGVLEIALEARGESGSERLFTLRGEKGLIQKLAKKLAAVA